jgi:hypothetical protein
MKVQRPIARMTTIQLLFFISPPCLDAPLTYTESPAFVHSFSDSLRKAQEILIQARICPATIISSRRRRRIAAARRKSCPL